MTDPDDDALSWEGDDRLRTAASVPRPGPARPSASRSGGSAGLIVLGVLTGIAVLEALFWARGVTEPAIAASVDVRSSGGMLPFAVNIAGRVLAVLAPLAWFAAVLAVVREPSRRVAWLALGAVLLVPWPAVLAAA